MPITPTFKWEETERAVQVVVALPGASKSKSDVFATECMIKVNLSPYLLVLDLHGEVDSSKTVATFTANESVTFKLVKKAAGLWGQLGAIGSKDELTARRNASIDRAHAAMEEARKQRLERKQKEEKEAIDRQIEIDRLKRQEIERRKNEELAAERLQINKWQKQVAKAGKAAPQASKASKGRAHLPTVTEADAQGAESESEYETESEEESEVARSGEEQVMPDHPDYHGRGWWPSQKPTDAAGAGDGSSSSDDDDDGGTSGTGAAKSGAHQHDQSGDDDDAGGDAGDAGGDGGDDGEAVVEAAVTWRPLPPLRIRMEPVKVAFTALEMPHLPARESREAELKVYKQQIKRDTALLADSADVSDRQPVFLKDKGDGLFKQGNYRGAVAAYSRALDLDPSLPVVWSNRAAAHAKLGQHDQALEDASRALELLRTRQARFESGDMDEADIQIYKKQLVRALIRRGAALAARGQLQGALQEYEEAVRYDRSNTGLLDDIEELRVALAPPDLATLKARAVARFSAGDHLGAVEGFTAVLRMVADQPAEQLSGLSNRAAAYLAGGHYPDALRDCCTAIALALGQLHTLTCSNAAPQAPSTGGSGCEAGQAEEQHWERVLCRAADAAADTWGGGAGGGWSGQLQPCSGVRDQQVDDLLHACLATLPLGIANESGHVAGSSTVTVSGLLGSTARLLARRGAVHGHLKQYSGAVRDFESGAHVMTVLQETDKAAALLADAAKMRQLLAFSEPTAAESASVMSPGKSGGVGCALGVQPALAAPLHPPSHVC